MSVALGSEQCLQCSNAYIALVLPFVLAGGFVVFIIKALDLTVCHGAINGIIFYANVVSANKHLFYHNTATNPLTLFIAWFNLDLGIQTCFYDGLTAYAICVSSLHLVRCWRDHLSSQVQQEGGSTLGKQWCSCAQHTLSSLLCQATQHHHISSFIHYHLHDQRAQTGVIGGRKYTPSWSAALTALCGSSCGLSLPLAPLHTPLAFGKVSQHVQVSAGHSKSAEAETFY